MAPPFLASCLEHMREHPVFTYTYYTEYKKRKKGKFLRVILSSMGKDVRGHQGPS